MNILDNKVHPKKLSHKWEKNSNEMMNFDIPTRITKTVWYHYGWVTWKPSYSSNQIETIAWFRNPSDLLKAKSSCSVQVKGSRSPVSQIPLPPRLINFEFSVDSTCCSPPPPILIVQFILLSTFCTKNRFIFKFLFLSKNKNKFHENENENRRSLKFFYLLF